ncbi:hypothetical protein [Natronorubrum thiooxidans]|uniref:Uncharacterized protein n=1 Tax=Natronorubrum thiooxidans TaxID=308853 RepID=A0A1N7ELI5_9EURY|nr:hypothetical protein [Natronorubrum thiooxidans]SIR88795.1 hypothetical protein SAMN05421752_104213 [Natronorubrum thiooxidans]
MASPSRRTLLCGTAGLFVLSAGCLDAADVDASAPENDADDTTASSADGSNAPSEPDAGGANGSDPEQTASETTDGDDTVPFRHADAPTAPDARLFGSIDRAEQWLEERPIRDDQPLEFVADTDFENSALLALEADAPRLDYELVLESVTLEHDDGEPRLVVEASVSETAGDVGATQLGTVGRLIRATADGEPVTSATVTIVDSSGRKHRSKLTVDPASESASGSERDDR